MNIIISLILLLLIFVGIILLQIFLSKKENKWLGLILPLITLMFSLLMVFGISVFTFSKAVSVQEIGENGQVISKVIEGGQKEPVMSTGSLIGMTVVIFSLYNIPTVVLLAIYAACREKRKRNLAIEKMSVQDLE